MSNSTDTERIRLIIEAKPELSGKLDGMIKDGRFKSLSDLFIQAMGLMDLLLDAQKTGDKLIYKHADGREEVIEISRS